MKPTEKDEDRIKRRTHAVLVPYYLKPAAITAIENDIWRIFEEEIE